VNYFEDSPVSLTTAAPGWRVKISTDDDNSYPVVAWATVVQTYTEAGDHAVTTVEPVFLYDGVLHTSSEWYAAMGDAGRVRVIEP